nr:hypothetical protein 16 [bacterium]
MPAPIRYPLNESGCTPEVSAKLAPKTIQAICRYLESEFEVASARGRVVISNTTTHLPEYRLKTKTFGVLFFRNEYGFVYLLEVI